MDLATIIGFAMGAAILLGLTGGHFHMFVSMHATMVVFGGLIASTFIKFGMREVFQAGGIIGKCFIVSKEHPQEVISQIIDMANIARKDGILALEKVKPDNQFLQSAINHCVDGVDPEFLQEVLLKEVDYLSERHHVGILMFESMGEAAPAFGMVGTLFGMVEMLANMSDPSSIGPAMATALLATTYGAVVANLITVPMSIKLGHYSKEEKMIRQIIIDGIIGIQKGINPRMLEQMLKAALPPKLREV